MPSHARQTIAAPILMSGIELHTGKNAVVRLLPATSGSGILFLKDGNSVSAAIQHLGFSHQSTTTIVLPTATIGCVEHLLSALFGLHITDICIEVIEGTEIPVLDGSAQPWIEAIHTVGIKELDGSAPIIQLLQKTAFKHGISEYWLEPNDSLKVHLEINFPQTIIGTQTHRYYHRSDTYAKDIAWARTFLSDGANGDTLDRDKILRRLKSVDIDRPETCPCVLYEQMKFITPLRHNNEPVAHKLLDFLGDLSLIGGELCATITAKRPSHQANHLLVQKLIQENLVKLSNDPLNLHLTVKRP